MMAPIFSLENIHRQYLNCRRNKRNTLNALRFEYDLEENLVKLKEELEAQSYTPSRSVCFVVNQPKLREIFAADFRDRIVHHILVDSLEKIWEPPFIYDSYACRKGKGTHQAVKRLQTFMRKESHNQTRRVHFMHLDFRSFFVQINKEILFEMIAKRLKDERVKELTRTVIFHDCTKLFVFKGKRDLLEKVPPHKTLFNTGNQTGLPIGNLTSQFFANVYLNELDQFVKHSLKIGSYLRYCDDFVFLHEERERLNDWKEKIKDFLNTRLELTLNDRRENVGQIQTGLDFLGYIVKPDYLLVRRRVVNNLKARLIRYEKAMVRRKSDATLFRYDPSLAKNLFTTWSSYMGHLKMANTYRLRKNLLGRFEWLGQFFLREEGKLKKVDEMPVSFHSLKQQYRFFLKKYSGSILFIQVGRFYEFYEKQAEMTLRLLGLKKIKAERGFQNQCGFPLHLQERYLNKLIRLGFSVHIVREGDGWFSGVKKRLIAEKWVPVSSLTE